jgi:hypothetical protein
MHKNLIKHIQNRFYIFEKVHQKETRFSHIAMFVNASETPFLS